MTLTIAIAATRTAITDANLTRGDGAALTVGTHDATPGSIDKPGAVAVTFGGMDSTEWQVIVRLYVDASSDVAAAESFVQTTVPALDAALDEVPAPRSAWSKSYSPDLQAYVVETSLIFPRDDF